MRRRSIRLRVTALALAVFVAAWVVIGVQLASGHDPALSASAKRAAVTATTGSSGATTTSGSTTSAGTTTSGASTTGGGSTTGGSSASSTTAGTTPVTTSQS